MVSSLDMGGKVSADTRRSYQRNVFGGWNACILPHVAGLTVLALETDLKQIARLVVTHV